MLNICLRTLLMDSGHWISFEKGAIHERALKYWPWFSYSFHNIKLFAEPFWSSVSSSGKWGYVYKTRIIFWVGGPCSTGFLLSECSRNPSVSVYQLVVLWEAVFGFREFFWRLSVCFPIYWRLIYGHTCSHLPECSAVFDQKQHDPCALPSPFIPFCTEWLFFACLFPWTKKKSSNGNILLMWKRWNKKIAEVWKASK